MDTLYSQNQQMTILDYFPDTSFAGYITIQLGKSSYNDYVTPDELSSITHIHSSMSFAKSLEGIEHLPNLESLTLDFLNLAEIEIPDSIGELNKLEVLQLKAGKIETIPDSIGNLINLKKLDLTDNNIQVLPSSIQNLQNLELLYLSFNQFQEIPNFIGELENLTALWFDDNQIQTISSSIGDLINLVTINLNGNQIQELPSSISNLSNLQHLYLELNQFHVFPNSIYSLTNLENLNLKRNQLQTLSNSIGNLVNLEYLCFSQNQLQEIPTAIGNLTNLSTLLLDQNQLREIPDSVGNLTNLRNVNLSDNQLQTIPDSFSNLTNMGNLILCNNQLTDSFSQSMLTYFSSGNVYINNQHTNRTLTLANPFVISYDQLLTPLILQAQAENGGILAGQWSITRPDGSTITLNGGNGSEIMPVYFAYKGRYQVTFQWTAKAPYARNIFNNGTGLNFQSHTDLTIVSSY